MTERGARQLQRTRDSYTLGPSRVAWNGQCLQFDIDERAAPLPRLVRGRVRVHPLGLCRWHTALDAAARHRWGPIAPCARVEVDLPQPGLRWQGQAYLDSNEGDEPVERGFLRWDWLRGATPDGRCAVVYDTEATSGQRRGVENATRRVVAENAPRRVVAARFARDGSVEPFEPPPRQRLPDTRWWRLRRHACADAASVQGLRALEDTPFYARTLLQARLHGMPLAAVHETLDLQRLRSSLVQALLPVRMPRRP